MSAANVYASAPFHLRAKALTGPPTAFFVGLLEHEKRIGDLLLQAAEVARMTAEAQQKRVAYIEAFLRGSDAANVTLTARAQRVEATPPPRDSEVSARPLDSEASPHARAGARGWTEERRQKQARLVAARNASRAKSQSPQSPAPQSQAQSPQSHAQSLGPEPPEPSRAVSGISSLSGSSQNLSRNPLIPPSSSGSSSPREAQSQAQSPRAPEPQSPGRMTVRHKEEGPEEGGKEFFKGGREGREEGADEGPKWTTRAVHFHGRTYSQAIRAAFPRPWALDSKGVGQVEAVLAGECFGAYLDGSTEAEAEAWYREQCAGFVSHQLLLWPNLTYFRPEQFMVWLDKVAGPVGHASAERRKAVAREIQRGLREGAGLPAAFPPPLDSTTTQSLADALLGGLHEPLGALRTGAAITGPCTVKERPK